MRSSEWAGALGGTAALLAAPSAGAALLAAAGEWLVLAAALAWAGGLIWQLAVLRVGAGGRAGADDARRVSLAARAAAVRRFERALWWLIGLAVLGNIVVLAAEATLTGDSFVAGLRAVLQASSFGRYWFLRQVAGLAGWLVLVLLPLEGERIAERRLAWRDGLTLVAALVLLGATAASGRAAATTGALAGAAVPLEWLRLVGLAAWLGGLAYAALALVPAVARMAPEERGRALTDLLARGAPVALAGAALATAITVAQGATTLGGAGDLLGTGVGLALTVQGVAALALAALAGWRAWELRPRIQRDLGRQAGLAADETALRDHLRGQVAGAVRGFDGALRAESGLALALVAGLALAGVAAGPTGGGNVPLFVARGVPLVVQQVLPGGGNAVFILAPAKVGDNTLTIELNSVAGIPLGGGTAPVSVASTMLDMPMGVQTITAAYIPADRDYTASVPLVMAGHWRLAIQAALPGEAAPVTLTFDVTLP